MNNQRQTQNITSGMNDERCDKCQVTDNVQSIVVFNLLTKSTIDKVLTMCCATKQSIAFLQCIDIGSKVRLNKP